MGREYGAVERDSGHPGPPSASGGGWPSWWRGARGCASFFGTRESVLAGNILLEAQAAMVVSACVATLSNGLFHHDSSARVDPSLPWSEQRAAVAAGANSPTFVSLVSVRRAPPTEDPRRLPRRSRRGRGRDLRARR